MPFKKMCIHGDFLKMHFLLTYLSVGLRMRRDKPKNDPFTGVT